LSETHTGTNRDLRSDDTVASEEGRGEDVHGTTFSVGHADLATEELANDTFDRAATHDGEGVAAVCGDDAVVLADAMLEANGNSFL
jgi:DNA-binding ferritin-like protein (Dps family)